MRACYRKFFVVTFAIQGYFNQDPSRSFMDPYRAIERPGINFEEVLLKEIGTAEKRVWIAVQELRLPHLYNLLLEKKKAGVDVRLILENQYSGAFPYRKWSELAGDTSYAASRFKDYFLYIDANGDQVIDDSELATRDVLTQLRAGPIPWIDDTADGSKGSGLMHHKFVLIDDNKVIVTSANFTWSDFFGDFGKADSRGNANNLEVLTSTDASRIFEEEYLEMWDHKHFGVKKRFRGLSKVALPGGRELWVQFAPSSPSEQKVPWVNSALGSVDALVGRASQTVDLGLFVFSEQKIADTLAARVSKGVKLRALVESEFAYRDFSEILDIFGLQMLNRFCKYEVGNQPWAPPQTSQVGSPRMPIGDKFHHKFAVIDQEWSVFGSLNWSAAGNHINDETVVALKDAALASQFTREFERSQADSFDGIPPWLPSKITAAAKACVVP